MIKFLNMNKTIVVQVDNPWYLDEKEENQKSIMQFGMELPTEIHLVLSESLSTKLKKMQEILKEESLTSIKTLSSYRKAPDPSYAVLYRNGKALDVHYYEDFDTTFPTVDLNCFSLECTLINGVQFVARFLYVNAACADIEIITKPFKIN